MPETSLKAMTANRALKAGHFLLEFATPGIGYILKEAACDFAILDTEHSGFGIETVKQVMAYMRAADLPTVVRVPSKAYEDIARVCDMGADGIMLPMVGNAGEAEHIVSCMKYVPRGRRGVILRAAHDRYAPGPTMEKLQKANAETTLVVQIETAEGVENAQAIAAVDGVDVLWVGHFDLSCSLGVPGEFDHPKFTGAIERVVQACRDNGKSLGRLVPDVASGIAFYKQGFDFIAYSADAWVLGDAVASALDDIREGCR